MALTIGLTGSIATGKSTISQMFTEMNIPVVDADQVARKVVEPGEEALEEIAKVFGSDILNEQGGLNREKLGAIVFTNEEKRKQLNAITHPAIRKRVLAEKEEHIQNGEQIIVLDIPLLFESKLEYLVDRTLVVSVDEEIQLTRLMERNDYTKEEAMQRIQSQIPVKEKAKRADAVIDNNGTIDESRKQLVEIIKTLQAE